MFTNSAVTYESHAPSSPGEKTRMTFLTVCPFWRSTKETCDLMLVVFETALLSATVRVR